jgi:hypothetical protein
VGPHMKELPSGSFFICGPKEALASAEGSKRWSLSHERSEVRYDICTVPVRKETPRGPAVAKQKTRKPIAF